jgi:uncharacterized membrane protein
MRNPNEPRSISAGYSERHSQRPVLLGIAGLFGVLAFLMCFAFAWGLILLITSSEFFEAPMMILIGSTLLGGFCVLLSLFFIALYLKSLDRSS